MKIQLLSRALLLWLVVTVEGLSTSIHTQSSAISSAEPAQQTSSILDVSATNATDNYPNVFQLVVRFGTSSSEMEYSSFVQALTTDASRTGAGNVLYEGQLVKYTANSSVTLDSDSIAYISCDDENFGSQALTQAVSMNPSCILLYSTSARTCYFVSSYKLYSMNIGAVYSTVSAYFSRQLLSAVSNSVYGGNVNATITVNETDVQNALTATTTSSKPTSSAPSATSNYVSLSWTSSTATAASPSDQDSEQNETHTTAVAMIVLYSVTGLISGFFLLIIILGAIRAHRHPERYQVVMAPDGTVQRTNRARGLAKAVLDSIPLVRIPESHSHRTADVENAETNEGIKMNTIRTENEVGPQNGSVTTINDADQMIESNEQSKESNVITPQESNGSTISLPASLMISTNECPICFEPFKAGQNLRVLPCHHGFHADCVDPWLLNSSSQCPLCRVDLSMRAEAAAANGEIGDNVDGDNAEAADVSHSHSRRFHSRVNRLLDTFNAQLLPREERRVAMERIRAERMQSSENRGGIQENTRESDDSVDGHAHQSLHTFMETRRRLFHIHQQQQRIQRRQQQRQEEERQRQQQELGEQAEEEPSLPPNMSDR
ncbi:hypothetical protein V1511DRAFT_520615 [Dipodascopsis uninucleata]